MPLGNIVELRTTVTPALNNALNELVAVSGAANATLIRQGLTDKLVAMGALHPGVADELVITRTSGSKYLSGAGEHVGSHRPH